MLKAFNTKLIMALLFISIHILCLTNGKVHGEASLEEEGSSTIVIVNLDDPFKKWDSLSIQLLFFTEDSLFQKSYVVSANSKPDNITVMIENRFSRVKFSVTVESQWWMTDFYRLSNNSNYYWLEPGEVLVLDLKYEIYSNRMWEIASELKSKISGMVEEGFIPQFTASVVENMVEEGISYAKAGDYLTAIMYHRKILMVKNTVDNQIARLTTFAPVSFTILYAISVFFAIFMGNLASESRLGKAIIAVVTFSLSWLFFISFAPDVKLLFFGLTPESRLFNSIIYALLLVSTFVSSMFLIEKAKDLIGVRRLSSILMLAVRDIRRRAFRYTSLILASSFVTGSLVFLLTLGTAYVKNVQTVKVTHSFNAITIESPIGILDEDYSWIVSLTGTTGISQVFIDDAVVGLPAVETATVKAHGYFFLTNLKNESIKVQMACRIFLNKDVMNKTYRIPEALVEGRCPLNENEALLCYDKARLLNVNLGDEVAYYGYIPHVGYRVLGTYKIVGLLNGEMLTNVKELNGGDLLKISVHNPYGDYGFHDVMICVWNGQTPITRLSVLFGENVDPAKLEELAVSLALNRVTQRYTVWLIQNGTALGIRYSEAFFTHGLIDAMVPISLSTLLSFMVTFQMLNERTSDLRTLAILGLNPTDLKRLVLIQLTLAESAAGFLGYFMGAILFPISMSTYIKSGLSYQAIVIALMILVSLLGGYFPASKVYSRTTPSLIYKWKPLESITREGITHQLPLIIQMDEILKIDEFLRGRMSSVMESENPNIKVEVKYAKIKPEERLYFYQVNYNLFPFDMTIRLYKEAAHFNLQVNIRRNVFVSSEHYRVILECVRKAVLTYNIERT